MIEDNNKTILLVEDEAIIALVQRKIPGKFGQFRHAADKNAGTGYWRFY
jgi:hypothetical protein